jgi:hypothetical protein
MRGIKRMTISVQSLMPNSTRTLTSVNRALVIHAPIRTENSLGY